MNFIRLGVNKFFCQMDVILQFYLKVGGHEECLVEDPGTELEMSGN
jgi:hypothetical protein